jgi:hypothetical protein
MRMKRKKVVIKIGGSLLHKARAIMQTLKNYAQENGLCIIIVPGGGPFAEVIRNIPVKISEEAAHWMAILSMHQYGLYLANGDGEIPLVEHAAEIDDAMPLTILQPYKMVKEDEKDDCMPHTWDVTSDTIAAFIAHNLGENTFIKLTDVDGIMDEEGQVIKKIHPKDMLIPKNSFSAGFLYNKTCVDNYLPLFLMHHELECIIVNGNYPERIKRVIEGKETETICTQLLF